MKKEQIEELLKGIDQMNDEEMQTIFNATLKRQVTNIAKSVSQTAGDVERVKKKVKDISLRLEQQQKIIDEHTEALNVVGIEKNSMYRKRIQSAYTKRIHEILGERGDDYYNLWAPFFYHAIQKNISNYFGVDRIYNISVNDVEEAIQLASKWCPDDEYIHYKLQDIHRLKDTGMLKQGRIAALHIYMKDTDNGKINPFSPKKKE